MSSNSFLKNISHTNSSPKELFLNIFPVKKQKHTIYVRKLNKIDGNDLNKSEKISQQIDNYFNCPDTYFSKNNHIIVGKKTEIDEDMKITIEKKKKRKNVYSLSKKSNTFLNQSHVSNLSTNRICSENRKNDRDIPNLENKNFEVIDNNRLNEIFKSFKEANKNDNNCPEVLPNNICSSLENQEKQLFMNKIFEKSRKSISKFLSKKVDKNEKELLINQIDSSLYKNEITNNPENNSPFCEKYKWRISLRKPKNFKGVINTYINISTDKNPMYGVITENNQNEKQISIKPNLGTRVSRNLKNYMSNASKNMKFEENIKNLRKLDSLSIKGKKLLDLEYEREMSLNSKKILHKVFIDNGEIISRNELNHVFGEKTFYKNYGSKNEKFYFLTERLDKDKNLNKSQKKIFLTNNGDNEAFDNVIHGYNDDEKKSN